MFGEFSSEAIWAWDFFVGSFDYYFSLFTCYQPIQIVYVFLGRLQVFLSF